LADLFDVLWQFHRVPWAEKYTTIQWLMFQMGGVGPMFGQLGFFAKFAGAKIEDPRPRERYVNEAKRLLAVIEKQLDGKDWITGEYSIADMAICPWLNGLDFYGVKDVLGWDDHKNIVAYHKRFYARPAVGKAKNIPPRG
jgi:GST-like protein